jgi:chitin synthase
MSDVPSLSDPWEVSEVFYSWDQQLRKLADGRGLQIVYCSIMGAVMIAALLEWFLWLAAFLYCLVKAFQKAEKWHSRVLAVLMMILFTAFR